MTYNCRMASCKREAWCPNCNGQSQEKVDMCLCCVVNQLKREQTTNIRSLNNRVSYLTTFAFNKAKDETINNINGISIVEDDKNGYKSLSYV